MLRKETKFYVINFIDPQIIFFLKKILTPRAIKTHVVLKNRIKKESGREGDVNKNCKWIRITLLLILKYIYFS